MTGATDAAPRLPEPCASRELAVVYDRYFDCVERWARALGVREADLEDLAQEVFIVVARKLPRFDGVNLAGWLYRITARKASDYRRGAWFRRVFFSWSDQPEVPLRDGRPGPLQTLEQGEAWHRLERLLKGMRPERRAALVLFEVEGYRGEEIAMLQRVPVGTVWTRLHHARRELMAALARDGGREERR